MCRWLFGISALGVPDTFLQNEDSKRLARILRGVQFVVLWLLFKVLFRIFLQLETSEHVLILINTCYFLNGQTDE